MLQFGSAGSHAENSVTSANEASSFRVGMTKGFLFMDTSENRVNRLPSGTATGVYATG